MKRVKILKIANIFTMDVLQKPTKEPMLFSEIDIIIEHLLEEKLNGVFLYFNYLFYSGRKGKKIIKSFNMNIEEYIIRVVEKFVGAGFSVSVLSEYLPINIIEDIYDKASSLFVIVEDRKDKKLLQLQREFTNNIIALKGDFCVKLWGNVDVLKWFDSVPSLIDVMLVREGISLDFLRELYEVGKSLKLTISYKLLEHYKDMLHYARYIEVVEDTPHERDVIISIKPKTILQGIKLVASYNDKI